MDIFPQWIPFNEETKPAHGEYMVLFKQDSEYPYIAVANYTYDNGGQWLCGEKVITNQIEAYQSPRILPEYMIDEDKPTNEARDDAR